MPNVKRRFADDDPSSSDDDDNDDEEVQVYRGGGKGMRMPGGKGMGKQLRAPPMQDSSSDEDDDDEDEAPSMARGGGKQLRTGGGKQLRAPPVQDDSDDDDDDDDDDEAPVVPVARGGGKTLIRAPAPDDDDDDSEDEPVRPVGGGKQLRPPRGGKQLRAPVADDDDDDDDDEPVRPPGGGKTLRPPPGGKTLRPPGGGKQLRAQAPESDEDDEEEEEKEEEPIAAPDEDVDDNSDDEELNEETKTAPVPSPASRGGKQLRRPPVKEESDDDDDDDMEMDSDEDEDEPEPPKPAPKKRGRPAKKPAKEADAMEEESDDDDDESSDEEMEMDMETFDTQKLVQNDDDQKYLDSLPEIEREAILAERFEKRKAEMDMKKVLREAKKREREAKAATKQGDAKKRKTTPAKKPATRRSKAAEEEDAALAKTLAGKRESVRNKDAKGTKAQKAKALAALREERKKATRKDESESESDFGEDDEDSDDDYDEGGVALKPWQKQASQRRTSSRLDQALSDDEDEDDIKEENEEVAALGEGRAIVEADLDDYQKITLPRRRLGRWCNEPYFKEAVLNCYVKLFIGENDTGKRCYRLCKIVDIKSNKTYQLPPVKNQKPVSTDKMLTLKFGKNQRDFPISLVSDAKVDEADMKQYVDTTKGNRERTLGKKEANKMRRQQDKLVSDYVYTTADIEENLRNRKKKGETAANLGLERTRAAIAVQGARAALKDATFQLANAKNPEEINDFEQVVAAAEKLLEEKLAEEHTVKDRVKDRKMRLAGRSKDQKWALVNKRALEMNQKVDRGEMAPKTNENENSAAKATFNPYARRKVKPKILWEVGQNDEQNKAEDGKDGDASKDRAAESAENGGKDLDSAPALIQEHHHKAAALSQSHQFAIDEEFLAQSSYTTGIAGIGSKKAPNRVRKGLSLAEYQEKKAIGAL